MAYNPAAWYWTPPAGQNVGEVYSSAAAALVATTNAAYVAWSAGHSATPCPKDESGTQQWSILDAVLAAAGLPATGLASPTKAQLQAYLGAKVAALTAASRDYTVDGVTGAISCDCSQSANHVQQALQWATATPTPTGTLPWLDNNWTPFPLTAAEAAAFANAVGAYEISVFAVSFAAAPQIVAGTITTTAQIDALSWPT